MFFGMMTVVRVAMMMMMAMMIIIVMMTMLRTIKLLTAPYMFPNMIIMIMIM